MCATPRHYPALTTAPDEARWFDESSRQPAPELDVSRTPSEWFTDSRMTNDGMTEVCVVRVENKTA
jgi:hypothetical protein